MRESSRWTEVAGRWASKLRLPLFFGVLGIAFVGLHRPLSAQLRAETFSFDRPDAHGPAGMRGDHLLQKGEFEFGYRFENRDRDGLRDGSEEVATELVLRDFAFAPVTRRGLEHTAEIRYGISDGLTLQVEVPYLSLESGHLVNGDGPFSTEVSGLGDVRVSGLASVYTKANTRAHLTLGASIPTGAIDNMGVTPAAPAGTVLPYEMQLGTGSFDLLPSATVLVQNPQGSVGAQLGGRLHLGDNDRGYRLGDRIRATAWLGPRINDVLSLSFRILYENFDGISGVDSGIDGVSDPTGSPENHGGEFVEIPVGLNLFLTDGPFAGHRLNAELSMPVHQDYNGVQPNRNFRLLVTWRKSF